MLALARSGRCIASLALLAAALPPAASAQTWAISYDDFEPYAVVAAADGGVLAMGGTPTGQPPVIVRLDADGNPAWRIELVAGNASSAWAGVETPSGFLVLDSVGACGSGCLLAHLSANGSIDWQLCMDQVNPEHLISTTDGSYVACGKGFPFPATDGLVKFDGTGAVAWGRGLPPTPVNSSEAAVAALPGGGVLYALGGDAGDFQLDAWFFAFDALGNLLWKKALSAPDDQRVQAAVPSSDGGAFVLIRTYNPSVFLSEQQVVRIAGDGTFEWATSLRGDCLPLPEYMAPAADGGVLVVGVSYETNGIPHRWLAHVTPSGTVDWQRVGPARTRYQSVAQAAGGGWFLTTYPRQVHRVDETGDARTNCTENPVTPCTTFSRVLTEIPLQATPMPFTLPVSPASVLAPISPQTLTRCPLGACASLSCGVITATPPAPCSFDTVELALDVQGGEQPFTVRWDFDGDGLPDATGNPVTTTANVAGSWQVDATVTDSCTTGVQSCSQRLVLSVARGGIGEVSDVVAGAPPLLIGRGAPGVRVERLATALAYNAYVDALGSWAPMSSGWSQCGLTAWTDHFDGTLTLDVDPPVGTWVLVTASDACGEGSTGSDSLGNLRSSFPGWTSCP